MGSVKLMCIKYKIHIDVTNVCKTPTHAFLVGHALLVGKECLFNELGLSIFRHNISVHYLGLAGWSGVLE
jgi:hypothetical protein